MARERTTYPPKITQPRSGKILERERLFDSLDQWCDTAPLVWLCAPGGAGKTTLVTSWLMSRERKSIWYQIDEGDRDPASLFHYLGMAAKRVAPRRKNPLPEMRPEYLHGLVGFTRGYFEELSRHLGHKGVIVFDNFQLLDETDPVVQLLITMAESVADICTIVVISRNRLPDRLVGMVAQGLVKEVNGELLQFTEDEWLSLSELSGVTAGSDELLSLHHRMHGWAAGLILCQNELSGESDDVVTSGDSVAAANEAVFNYFAHEFFLHLDEKLRWLLLSCAYLEYITIPAARTLSGQAGADKSLRTLYRKNTFVQRQGGGVYTLHPLLRRYLQSEASRGMGSDVVDKLKMSSAEVLVGQGEYDSALSLLISLRQWDVAAQVIRDCAGELFQYGRLSLLGEALESLPAAITEMDTSLQYWQAAIMGYANVAAALDLLEHISGQYIQEKNSHGARMAFNLAMRLMNASWQETEHLPYWLTYYEENCELFSQEQSEPERYELTANLAHGYIFSGVHPMAARYWFEQLEKCAADCVEPAQLANILPQTMFIVLTQGYANKAQRYLEMLNTLDATEELSPLRRLDVLVNRMMGETLVGEPRRCLELLDEARELSRHYGITLFDGILHICALIAALKIDDTAAAKRMLGQLQRTQDSVLINSVNYYWGSALVSLSCGEFESAEERAKQAIQLLSDQLAVSPYRLLVQLTLVEALLAKGEESEAELHLREATVRASKLMAPDQQIHCHLLWARLAERRAEASLVREQLASLFALAKKHGMQRFIGWRAEPITWACQMALELGVEESFVVEYVRSQIHLLTPVSPETVRWYWPVRIHLLGEFRLEVDGMPIRGRDLQVKRLLMFLSAHPDGIESQRVADLLYSDKSPQNRASALRKVLQRLRAMLGDENAVVRDNEWLRLNPRLCWVDADAFTGLLAQKTAAARNQALALYQGEFLSRETLEELELIGRREALRGAFHRALLEQLDEVDVNDGIELCHQALRIEPLAEVIYQRLIGLYQEQGREELARASYEQCRRLLLSELGVEPTAATRRIARVD